MYEEINPFQSPSVISTPTPEQRYSTIPFESGHLRAVWTIVMLAITGAADLVGVAVVTSADLTHPTMSLAVMLIGIGGLTFLSFIGAVICFSMWTHRAARNLPALGGRNLQYQPGWAVGWFFIPLANLVMPCLVINEIWRESDPAQGHLGGQFGKTSSPLVVVWWCAFISVWVVSAVVRAATIGPQDPVGLILVAGLRALAAVLAILVVLRVDANQQAKYDLIIGEQPAR